MTPNTETEDLRQQWQQWREERNEGLREPHGWLSLIGLEWVNPEPARLRHFPGLWSARGLEVTVEFTTEDGVSAHGQPVVGTHTIILEQGEQDKSLEAEDGRQAEVASRFDRVCVRTRDPQAPTRLAFTETDTYDFDPEWIVSGTYRPASESSELRVPSAQPGGTVRVTVQGEVDVLGQTMTVTGGPDSLGIIFHDATNGESTEGWRSAPVAVDEETGAATVDFNRAANFPASFTAYGTCPTPPEGNRFEMAITAGEKKNR